jgi:hypothetical protein
VFTRQLGASRPIFHWSLNKAEFQEKRIAYAMRFYREIEQQLFSIVQQEITATGAQA